MQVETVAIPEMTLEQFADANGLVMEVRERRLSIGNPMRFYAHFRGAEIGEGDMLGSAYGNGATPEAAIAACGQQISLKHLVIDAYKPTRREIAPARAVTTGRAPHRFVHACTHGFVRPILMRC